MPAPQVPHKQPTSVKNYNEDDPSNSSCVLSLIGTFSITLEPSHRRRHCHRPDHDAATVPNHDDDEAVTVTALITTPSLSSP